MLNFDIFKSKKSKKIWAAAIVFLAVFGVAWLLLNSQIIWQVKAGVVNNGNIFYGDSANDGNLNFRTYTHPTTVGGEGTSVATTSYDITFVKAAACPTRDEKIAVHLKQDERLDALLCAGGCDAQGDWSSGFNVTGVGLDATTERPFDVAYEQLSGRAMVAYAKTNVGRIYYKIWDGDTWSTEASVIFSGSVSRPKWVRLVAKGDRLTSNRSNEILLAFVDTSSDLFTARWDGDSWENVANPSDAVSSTAGQAFDIAWENESGEAMVAWGEGTDIKYSIFTPGGGGSWETPATVSATTSTVRWLEAASNPMGDEISMITGEVDASLDCMTFIWNGSSFATGPEDTRVEPMAGKNIATAWTRFSERALFMYTDNGELASDMVCWTSAGFSGVNANVGSPDIDNGDDVEDIVLTASPNSDRMLLTRHDIDDEIHGLTYDGTGCADDDWTAFDTAPLNTGTEGVTGSNTERCVHTSVYKPYSAWSHNWKWFDDETAADPADGTALAAECTAPTGANAVKKYNKIRLRMNIIELGGQGQTDARKKLQYATSVSGTWTDVDAQSGSGIWRYCDVPGKNDGDPIGAYKLTQPSTPLPTTRYFGPYVENGTESSTFDHNASQTAEFDFCVQHNGAAASTTYYFRAYDNDQQGPVLKLQTAYPASPCVGGTCIYPKLETGADNDLSESDAATANSFQRKTWYDGTRYWKSFYNGSAIEFWYSIDDGVNWTQNTSATISVATSDFSIEADSTNVFITYKEDNKIKARKAGLWFSDYSYRKKITLSHSNGTGAGTDYQVKLSIGDSSGGDFHLGGHCTNFPTDIRFTDGDETTELDYWIESTGDPATVWVKVDDSLEDTNQDIYIYYGKSGASDGSDATNTWKYFSDCDSETGWTDESSKFDVAGSVFRTNDGEIGDSYRTYVTGSDEANLRVLGKIRITSTGKYDGPKIAVRMGNTIDENYAGIYMRYSSSTASARYWQVSGYGGGTSSDSWTSAGSNVAIGQWYIFEFGVYGDYVKYAKRCKDDGTEVQNADNDLNISNVVASGYYGFRDYRQATYDEYDYLAIGKYASTDPAYYSIGGEESIGVYPSASFEWSDATDVFSELIYSTNEYEFNSATTDYVSVAALSATQFVVGYTDTGESANANARVGTVSEIDGSAAIDWSTNEYNFGSPGGNQISISALSATQFVVCYQSGAGKAKVGTVSGTGASASITLGSEAEFNAVNTTYISVSALGENATQFVVGYRDDGGEGYGHAKVGTVAGTGTGATITFSTVEYTFSGVATADYISVSALSATQFVVGYRASNNGKAKVGTVSGVDTGASIDFSSTEYQFAASCDTFSVSALGANATQFVVGYKDANPYARIEVGTVSGTGTGASIIWGNSYNLNTVDTTYISVSALNSNEFVVGYSDSGDSYNGYVKVGKVSGTAGDATITYSNNSFEFNDADTDYISVSALSPTQFAVGFKDDGGSDYGIAKIGTVYHSPQSYAYPSITREDTSNKIWTTAVGNDTTDYIFKARQSSAGNDITGWGTTVHSLDTSTQSNKYGVIVPLTSNNMYATWIDNATIEGKKYTSGVTKWITGNYLYRKKITISHSAGTGAGTDYQVSLSIGDSAGGDFHLGGHCTSFPTDIRFTDNDEETELEYWIEDTSDPATVWVKVADSLESSNQDIYIYYGKSGASDGSDGINTFLFFDDWHDNKYSSRDDQLPEWTQIGSCVNPTASAGFFDFPVEDCSQEFKTAWNGIAVFAVDFKARQADNVFDSSYAELELYKDDTHYYYWRWDQSTNFDFHIYGTSLIDGTWIKDTNWHDIIITRKSNGEWEIFLDDLSKGTETNTDFTDWTEIRLIKGDQNRRQNWDDLKIRKYASTPPAYSSVAAEQENPWGTAADTIATGKTGMANNISAVSDSSGYVHLAYIDSGFDTQYRKYTGTWGNAVGIDTTGTEGTPCEYSSMAIDTRTNGGIYAFWIRDNNVYYKKGCSPWASGDWGTLQTLEAAGGNTNKWVVAGYKDFEPGHIFAEWTQGSAPPYSAEWDLFEPTVCTAADPTLTFAISGDNAITFSNLNTASPRWAGDSNGSESESSAHNLTASTNSSSGYSITVKGDTLKDGGNSITAIGDTPTSVASGGTKQFGIRITSAGNNCAGSEVTPYNGASNMYGYNATASTADEIVSCSSASETTTYSMYYAGNIAGDTDQGDYSANLIYICTGNF